MSIRLSMILGALSTALLLGGCGNGGLLGKQGTGPDEFSVVTRAPLSLPPDYGLRPPRPGAKRPNEESTRDAARQQLLSNSRSAAGQEAAAPANPSGELTNGETALLKHAEALDADPDIRVLLERESNRIKEDDSLVESLVFWRNKTDPKTVVAPAAEAKRLRENAALGESPTKGRTPTVLEK